MKRTLLITLILCTVLFITTSSSIAQVIYGCVKNNGQLSIVSGPGQCKNNETPISWNNIQGIHAVAYGTVTFIGGGNMNLPPNVTVTHTSLGHYEITFNPNPFTPSVGGSQGFANMPTCLATSLRNGHHTTCTTDVGYNTMTGAWSAFVSCKLDGTDDYEDDDFNFICVQQ